MIRAILVAVAALSLVACAGTLPTPTSHNLPAPDAVIIPNPQALPSQQLCAYADNLEAAVKEWEAYVNGWAALAGRDPVSLDAFLREQETVDEILDARGLICPPAAWP